MKYRQATQLEIKVARPAPAAPMFSPQGRMKIGSSTMLRIQPDMVPMLAWTADPSLRTSCPCTTFRMVGAAPQVTTQYIYSMVACRVEASAPSRPSSGAWNTVQTSEYSSPPNTAPQKPKADALRACSVFPCPSERLTRLLEPTPNRLFMALNASTTG